MEFNPFLQKWVCRPVSGLCTECLYVRTVPPEIYSFAGVTAEEGQPASLLCMSRGDPVPDRTFHRTGHTHTVYRIGTNVCLQLFYWYVYNLLLHVSLNLFFGFVKDNFACVSGLLGHSVDGLIRCCWLNIQFRPTVSSSKIGAYIAMPCDSLAQYLCSCSVNWCLVEG